MQVTNSEKLHEDAKKHIVGGVNSPSRAYKGVGGGIPIYMDRAKGAYFWDVDGQKYIDYLAAYGPIITGHAHPHITNMIKEQVERGTLYGTPTKLEATFAKMLKSAIPSLDKVRFTNSGTEAVMTTIRVARSYTNRTKIIKFSGCYHGHFDAVLVEAGSGPATLGTPDSAGIPQSVANDVITVPFNNLTHLEKALNKWKGEIACVLVEPIVGNFGIVTPNPEFLESVNQLAHAHGALVIYDEVITAFRFTYGSAQQIHHVEPDLTAMGKIIGGGLPIGAYGGKSEIMNEVAPLGPAYQAGTMAGNPLSMAAGIACLEVLQKVGTYEKLDHLGNLLETGIIELIEKHQFTDVVVNRFRGALSLHFGVQQVTNYEEAEAADTERFGRFFKLMLQEGVNLAPSKYEAWFLTTEHTESDIESTIQAIDTAFAKL